MTTVARPAPSAGEPLSALSIARVDAASSWLHFTPGPPQSSTWIRLDQLPERDSLQRMRMALRGHCEDLPGVEAAAIASGVAYLISWLLLTAPALTDRRLQPAARDLWVGADLEHAWLDRLAIDTAVATTGVEAGRPAGIEVESVMATLVALVQPLVDSLVERRLLGRRALWGSVADAISYQALALANIADLDVEAAMEFGDALLSHMPASVQPPLWLTASRNGADHIIRVKQSCCLMYKTKQQGYCVTCPVADEATRSAQIEDWLAAG